MIKLKVLQVCECSKYKFLAKNGHTLSLIMELYGTDKLKQGDLVEICEDLLDSSSPSFVQPYAFQKCDKNEFDKLDEQEKMIVTSQDKQVLLKRIYG